MLPKLVPCSVVLFTLKEKLRVRETVVAEMFNADCGALESVSAGTQAHTYLAVPLGCAVCGLLSKPRSIRS